jgi:UDP-N-acetylmuramate--alanine ligase
MGMGPLAEIAQDAGFTVSGSDLKESSITRQLAARDIDIVYEQTQESMAAEHLTNPINWFIYTSALPDDHPELQFARDNDIRTSKRDEFLREFIKNHNLQLLAVAGTHGKTTTTGLFIWALKQLGLPVSYSIGTTISFGPSGQYAKGSRYFIYECDEYDRNFLQFQPDFAVITTLNYDHPDTYPTVAGYKAAFRQFIDQSAQTLMFEKDYRWLGFASSSEDITLFEAKPTRQQINLAGQFMRDNAFLVTQALTRLTDFPEKKLIQVLTKFPGTARRFEKLAPNLYSDYAHHPGEVKATVEKALELDQNVVIVYQPHQNIRQHQVQDQYKDAFLGVKKLYWLPTYLARENDLPVLTPSELIDKLSNKSLAEPAEMNQDLVDDIKTHLAANDLVLVMGAGPIDAWVRQHLVEPPQ